MLFARWRRKDLFFLSPYATAGIWTPISRVAPNQRNHLKDALTTEPPTHGLGPWNIAVQDNVFVIFLIFTLVALKIINLIAWRSGHKMDEGKFTVDKLN